MKKTLLALLATCSVALGNYTYTWVSYDGNTSTAYTTETTSAVMGGDTRGRTLNGHGGAITPVVATDDNGFISNYKYDERDTDFMRLVFDSALNPDIEAPLTFNISLLSYGSSNSISKLLQVGRKGYGVGLSVQNGKVYLTKGGNSTFLELALLTVSDSPTENIFNNLAITFSPDGVSCTNTTTNTLGEELSVSTSANQSVGEISWYAGDSNSYCIGMEAPGWEGMNLNSSLRIVSFSATTPLPEPAAATLSLLALAGLAARRRRKQGIILGA